MIKHNKFDILSTIDLSKYQDNDSIYRFTVLAHETVNQDIIDLCFKAIGINKYSDDRVYNKIIRKRIEFVSDVESLLKNSTCKIMLKTLGLAAANRCKSARKNVGGVGTFGSDAAVASDKIYNLILDKYMNQDAMQCLLRDAFAA